MKRVYLGRSPSRQPMQIDCTKEYSPAVYERLSRSLGGGVRHSGVYLVGKRLFDLFGALVLLLVLSPVMIVIAIAVALSGKGNILFCQERIGKDGVPFICYKFRTMTVEAPSSCPSARLSNRERYITRVGKFLRRYSLDELPQLFSVVKGDMSLVGYRPLVKEDALCHAYRERLSVYVMRPGITGYAQLKGRDLVSDKNKAFLDAYYVKNASFGFDCFILFKTVAAVLVGRGNRDAIT